MLNQSAPWDGLWYGRWRWFFHANKVRIHTNGGIVSWNVLSILCMLRREYYVIVAHNYSVIPYQECMYYHQDKPHIVCNVSVYSRKLIHTIISVVWYGLIFITSGIYQGAVYKFTLTVSKGYPDDGCPVRNFSEAIVWLPIIGCFRNLIFRQEYFIL